MFSFRLNFNRFVSNGKRDDRSYSLPLGTGPAYSSGRNSTASNISSIVHDPSPSPQLDSTAACEYISYAFFHIFSTYFLQNYSHLFQNLIVKIRNFPFTQKRDFFLLLSIFNDRFFFFSTLNNSNSFFACQFLSIFSKFICCLNLFHLLFFSFKKKY